MWVPFIGWMLSFLCSALSVALWIVLMVKAYQGEMYEIPIAGEIAKFFMSKET
jgi:uncharacterized membrane protein